MTGSDDLQRLPLLGAIEAGGTKFVCALGTGPTDIRAEVRFPTTTPEETMARAVAFFRETAEGKVDAIGVSCFGPIDLAPGSATYGYITSTPKPGWEFTDVASRLARDLDVPVGFDTDVNGAALAEQRWGAGQGLDILAYFTIGTGVGGGLVISGRPVHGLIHPEAGHILIPHDRDGDPYPGVCPFHGDCFEGLASGTALRARWGIPAEALPPDHPGWHLEARHIALALVNVICIVSPQRILLGGGVMSFQPLFPMVRSEVEHLLGGYLRSPALEDGLENYIAPPGLGNRSGILGGLALAEAGLAGG